MAEEIQIEDMEVSDLEKQGLREIQFLEARAKQLQEAAWASSRVQNEQGKAIVVELDQALSQIDEKREELDQKMARKGVARITLGRTQSCPLTYPTPELPTSPVGLSHASSMASNTTKKPPPPMRRRSSITNRTRARQIKKLHILDSPITFLSKTLGEVISVLKDPSPHNSPKAPLPQEAYTPAPVYDIKDLDDAPPETPAEAAPEAAPRPEPVEDGPRPPTSPPPAHLVPAAPPTHPPPPAPEHKEAAPEAEPVVAAPEGTESTSPPPEQLLPGGPPAHAAPPVPEQEEAAPEVEPPVAAAPEGTKKAKLPTAEGPPPRLAEAQISISG
mmetsp:Transcript_27384/g.67589  ORF Transcript_27384/g.67589 Transcript_27384/m.67589 type:complete len:330 (-) Transcript_27384:127-1116(-)|eukprot:CAMPEP_0206229068 /NCGR_PEP_ID=MMETSP0047_2-20121206/9498_1 /ASSEMBLY_ACC=CAM_ASM_000192 /TAXON_ID=195065 /ORGANISM="Chroomonas mesostigmatica_cf, Strain CCMP1168" /LENGTH=329 /DNA_ID=CAMNT_0053652339 /DNA_START=95 /DNA_END=1084 /DNA_ORIENTATION=-